MATYMILCKYTQKGVQEIKESPRRTSTARDKAASLGVTLKSVYLAMGRYDAVAIAEAADDETMVAFCLALAGDGAVTTETVRLWEGADFEAILDRVP